MPELPGPVGEPDFNLQSPSSGDVLTPSFSVWGTCSAIGTNPEPTITVTVGTSQPVTAALNTTAKTWEALVSGAPAGSQTILAQCGQGPSKSITVNIGSGPPPVTVIVSPPPLPSPNQDSSNPWKGYIARGTYDSTVTKVQIYITQDGNQIGGMHTAQMSDGKWSLDLSTVMSGKSTGSGFCVHVRTSGSTGNIRCSTTSFFSVPAS
jgi:hypothetical protein